MKKIIASLLVTLLLLTSCGIPAKTDTSSQTNEQTGSIADDAPSKETSDIVSDDSSQSTEKTEDTKPKEVVIYLTRHGKTMLNTADRVQGWADSPLTDAGVEVAQQLGKGLNMEGIKFDAAYSSDSGRAVETAQIVLEQCEQLDQIKLVEMKELREWNFGIFEGDYNENMLEAIAKTIGYEGDEDVRVYLPLNELADAIAKADETGTAEDWAAISERVDYAFNTIAKDAEKNGDENVLVVVHGLTINAILKTLDPDFDTVAVPNAAVAKIKYSNGAFTIETTNDVSYIEKGAGK